MNDRRTGPQNFFEIFITRNSFLSLEPVEGVVVADSEMARDAGLIDNLSETRVHVDYFMLVLRAGIIVGLHIVPSEQYEIDAPLFHIGKGRAESFIAVPFISTVQMYVGKEGERELFFGGFCFPGPFRGIQPCRNSEKGSWYGHSAYLQKSFPVHNSYVCLQFFQPEAVDIRGPCVGTADCDPVVSGFQFYRDGDAAQTFGPVLFYLLENGHMSVDFDFHALVID